MKHQQYTQGEYVTQFNHGALDMDVSTATDVKQIAVGMAKELNVKPGKKMGARGPYTITLSKEIWGEAFKKHNNES